jgi:26S proteasome regulatory subunit N8
MLAMFRKVNAKERIVGFYSTGPQIRPNDLRIHSMLTRFLPKGTFTPLVFCIIDVRPNRKSIPTTAYKMVQQVEESSKSSSSSLSSSSLPSSSGKAQVQQSFAHVPSMIGAMEAEEVGVEHLLRDINDPTISTISSLIQGKMAALASLTDKLSEMKEYLELIVDGKVKPNQDIIANMQSILNLLPNLNIDELVRALLIKTNDMHMVIYLSSLIRSVIALHDLVNNKIRYNEQMDKTMEVAVSGKDDKKSLGVAEEEDAKGVKNSSSVGTANMEEKQEDKEGKEK